MVRSIRALRDAEGTYDDPSTPTIDDQNWHRTFNAIDEYFWSSFGMSNIPLAYITREYVEPMEGEEDTWDDPLDDRPGATFHSSSGCKSRKTPNLYRGQQDCL